MALRLVFGHEDIFPSIEHLAKALIRRATVFGDRNAAFLVYREEGQVVRGNEVPVEDQLSGGGRSRQPDNHDN